MRAVLRYSRDGAAKWVSHLDMQRALARALRRADIPVKYSQGFNPHILMSFASPLSVGYATKSDYLEVKVEDGADTDEITENLNAVLPDDIRITETFKIDDKTKKLMALNHSASYEVRINLENIALYDKISRKLEQIMSSDEYIITDRKDRKKDIRAMISEAETDDGLLKCTLANSSSNSLNPAALVSALTEDGEYGEASEFVRTECFALNDGRVVPFYMLKAKPS